MPRGTVLIGYLPKRIFDLADDADAPRLPGVAEIRSVSNLWAGAAQTVAVALAE